MSDRYVLCINCNYMMSFFEHSQLRFDMPCPRCQAPGQFGPGAYVDGFKGHSMDEVIAITRGKKKGQGQP